MACSKMVDNIEPRKVDRLQFYLALKKVLKENPYFDIHCSYKAIEKFFY